MMIVDPVRQNKWLWPAVFNLWLGGAGIGFYLFVFITEGLRKGDLFLHMTWQVCLFSVFLMGLGFLLLSLELGRPSRGIYLFFNLGRSSISQEAACAFLFFCSTMLSILTRTSLFTIMAALAGAGLLFCQGLIVYREQGIPLWRVPAVLIFFVTSGLYSGAGIYWMLIGMGPSSFSSMATGPGTLCLVLNSIAWIMLQMQTRNHMNHGGRSPINRSLILVKILGLSHLLPLLLVLAGSISAQSTSSGALPGLLFFTAGFLAITGVGAQKGLLIRKSAYTSGVQYTS